MQLIVFCTSVKHRQIFHIVKELLVKIYFSYTAAVTAAACSPVCRLSVTLYTRSCEDTRPPYQLHLTEVDGFSDYSCF